MTKIVKKRITEERKNEDKRICTMGKLRKKQEKFCHEYLIDLNATQAAIRAGYSKHTAKEMGYEHLTKPHIQDFISELQAETRDRTLVTVDFVINGIKDIAEDGEQENNRLKAFDMLGKHLGVYEIDNTQKTIEINNISVKFIDV